MKIYDIKVSVIIPIYNVEKYLDRCINSIINQTFKDIEIILVNDGSTDGCKDKCEIYSKQDSRIKVINKKNGGLSDARNKGMNECKGEYILFIDSDDWCNENMISNMYESAIKNSSDLVVCGYYIDYVNDNNTILKDIGFDMNYNDFEEVKKSLLELENKYMFNVVWNKLYKKQILDNYKIKFYEDGMPGEDLIFNCEYFKHIYKVSFIKGAYYHYMRQDEETLVYKYRSDLYEKVIMFNNSRLEMYKFYGLEDGIGRVYYSNLYIENIIACVINIFRETCNLNKIEKKKFIRKLLDNKEIKNTIEFSDSSGFQNNLFKKLYNTNDENLFYLVYDLLFKLRYKFKKIYAKSRKFILNK